MTELVFKMTGADGTPTGKTSRVKLTPELGRGLLHAISHPPAEGKALVFNLGITEELQVYPHCVCYTNGSWHDDRPFEYVLPKAQRASVHCIPAFVPGLMQEIDLSGT